MTLLEALALKLPFRNPETGFKPEGPVEDDTYLSLCEKELRSDAWEVLIDGEWRRKKQ